MACSCSRAIDGSPPGTWEACRSRRRSRPCWPRAWIVEVARDRVEEQEEIVAYHLDRAYRLLEELGPLDDHARGLALQAAARYAACGRRASERGDDSAAATLFRHAGDLLPEGHPDRP